MKLENVPSGIPSNAELLVNEALGQWFATRVGASFVRVDSTAIPPFVLLSYETREENPSAPFADKMRLFTRSPDSLRRLVFVMSEDERSLFAGVFVNACDSGDWQQTTMRMMYASAYLHARTLAWALSLTSAGVGMIAPRYDNDVHRELWQ